MQVLVFRHLTTLWRLEWEKLSGWDWERIKVAFARLSMAVTLLRCDVNDSQL